jgi:uncharacterized protein YrzB (UPF0473 family)
MRKPAFFIFVVVLLLLPASHIRASTTIEGDFDGVPGLEFATITADTVRITSLNSTVIRQYSVARWNRVQQLDLDGQPGNELLFTNLRTINGVAQSAKATVVTHRLGEVRTYDVGKPNHLEVFGLDDQVGKEVLFTNLWIVNGFPQPAQAIVLTHRIREVRTYNVGRPNHFEIVKLDNKPGREVLFTNLMRINGFPQFADATILTHRIHDVRTYNVGRPLYFRVTDLDGNAGDEVAFIKQDNVAVITHFLNEKYVYPVGLWRSFQVIEADGVPGNELKFTRSNGQLLFVIHRTRTIRLLQ